MIIAFSAVSGEGKTTVIKELNKQLPLSKAIYFDGYDFKECPQDLIESNHIKIQLSVLIDKCIFDSIGVK